MWEDRVESDIRYNVSVTLDFVHLPSTEVHKTRGAVLTARGEESEVGTESAADAVVTPVHVIGEAACHRRATNIPQKNGVVRCASQKGVVRIGLYLRVERWPRQRDARDAAFMRALDSEQDVGTMV